MLAIGIALFLMLGCEQQRERCEGFVRYDPSAGCIEREFLVLESAKIHELLLRAMHEIGSRPGIRTQVNLDDNNLYLQVIVTGQDPKRILAIKARFETLFLEYSRKLHQEGKWPVGTLSWAD